MFNFEHIWMHLTTLDLFESQKVGLNIAKSWGFLPAFLGLKNMYFVFRVLCTFTGISGNRSTTVGDHSAKDTQTSKSPQVRVYSDAVAERPYVISNLLMYIPS